MNPENSSQTRLQDRRNMPVADTVGSRTQTASKEFSFSLCLLSSSFYFLFYYRRESLLLVTWGGLPTQNCIPEPHMQPAGSGGLDLGHVPIFEPSTWSQGKDQQLAPSSVRVCSGSDWKLPPSKSHGLNDWNPKQKRSSATRRTWMDS